MWDPYAEFETATLPNGLTVHAAHWPNRPWEAVGFLIHSGAEHDPVGLEGLAHFVEHLVGEHSHTPKKSIKAFFRDRGGMVSLGSTGYPETDYKFFVPNDEAVLARALSIFGYMLLSAKLEKFVERERQVIVGEFNERYPQKFKFDLRTQEYRALYGGYWLERFVTPLGNPESVGRITENDLQIHYDTHYTPANMSIVCVGGMKLKQILELVVDSPFMMAKRGIRTPLPTPATSVTPPSTTRRILETSQYMSVPNEVGEYHSVAKIPGDVNQRAIRVMEAMLEEVLGEEVRERRAWAYSISSDHHDFRHFYKFSINCSGLALEALNHIEEVVEGCIAVIGKREDLFQQTKQRLLVANLMTDPRGRDICDGALADLGDEQRIISLAELNQETERVTMEDIRSLLGWLRPDMRLTTLIRP